MMAPNRRYELSTEFRTPSRNGQAESWTWLHPRRFLSSVLETSECSEERPWRASLRDAG